MGTMIELRIGGVPIACAKNGVGEDFGPIFQEDDITHLPDPQEEGESDSSPFDAVGDLAFSAPLAKVLDRLDLMGVTPDSVRAEYERATSSEADEWSAGDENPLKPISFGRFESIIQAVPVETLSILVDFDRDKSAWANSFAGSMIREYTPRGEATPWHMSYDMQVYSEATLFADFISILQPLSILRALAKNEANLGQLVTWRFGPMVRSGWCERSDFVPGARPESQVLIVTEGSSDAAVLKGTIQRLRPSTVDFFRFLDIEEKWPFGGSGKLADFMRGLVMIGSLNKVLAVFDNDIAGIRGLSQATKVALPKNLAAMSLPELPEFCDFMTSGPTGEAKANINKLAAGIEAYLDHTRPGLPQPPKVRWTSHEPKVGYCGEMEEKSAYTKDFETWIKAGGSYNTRRLLVVIDEMYARCIAMAS